MTAAVARVSGGSVEAQLLLRAGTLLCALPARSAIETMRPLAIAPVAGVPPWVRGLARVRGTPTPVVALAGLLQGGDPPPGDRWVTVRADGRVVALEVDAVAGVRSLSATAAGALPPLLAGAAAEAIASVGALDRALLVVLEAGRLVPPDTWAAMETAPGERAPEAR